MSSHGDEKDAVSPGGDKKDSRTFIRDNMDSYEWCTPQQRVELPAIDFRHYIENNMLDIPEKLDWPDKYREESYRIKLKVYSCLLRNASLSDAQRVAIENRFGTMWSSIRFERPELYSIWVEFVREKDTAGLVDLDRRCQIEADELVEMVYTGVLSKDRWLRKYLQMFDESEPHIVAAIYQSLFLYHLGYHPDNAIFEDITMKDMLVVGNLTIMLYRNIHLEHFSRYFADEVQKFHGLRPNMLSELIRCWGLSSPTLVDLGSVVGICSGITIDMVAAWLVRSIQILVDDVRARAQPTHIPDQINLPSSHQVWNRAEHLKERLDDLKVYATGNNDESVLVRNMPISILCSAAAQELDLSICQMLYNEASLLPKLEASKYIDLDYVNELGGLVCVIEAMEAETGGKVCSCIIKDNLTGFLLCKDVENDRHCTKRRMFAEEAFQYVGTLQVTVTKERTTIESLQEDGSYFRGDFKDFAFGNRDVEGSCAAEALSDLPGSDFLQQSGLQCTALHIIALATCAGTKESLQLQWNGERGHIDWNCNLKESGFGRRYSECCVLYTKEGRELAGEVLWGMLSLKGKNTSQPVSTIRNPSNEVVPPEVECCGQPNGKGKLVGFQEAMSFKEDFGESPKVFPDQDIERGQETLASDVTILNNDMAIHESTITSTSTQPLGEAPTVFLHPPKATILKTTISNAMPIAVALPTDSVEGIMQVVGEALRKLLYPQEATVEEKAKLEDTAIAAVLMADKKNYNGGFSIMGYGLHAGLDRRSSGTDRWLKEYIREQLRARASSKITIAPLESRDEIHRHVERQFMNGSLKEDKEEYLVIRNNGDNTCVHVFLRDHSTQELIFLTDVSVGDGNKVTAALNSLNGNWLEARRDGSNIHVSVPHGLRYAHKILRRGQHVLRNMGEGPAIEEFPPSTDQWKHIIGGHRDHEGKGLYWNTTQMEAVICAATWFTTGDAVKHNLTPVRTEVHGSCTSSNLRDKHCIQNTKVCAVGRFSNFKGLGFKKIYWG